MIGAPPSLQLQMSDNDQTLRELRRINRRTTLTLWVVGGPIVMLALFWLAFVLIGPSVEMT